jgi:hypothetical protein
VIAIRPWAEDERSRPATGRLPSLGRIVPTEASHQNFLAKYYGRQRGVSRQNPDAFKQFFFRELVKVVRKDLLNFMFAVSSLDAQDFLGPTVYF